MKCAILQLAVADENILSTSSVISAGSVLRRDSTKAVSWSDITEQKKSSLSAFYLYSSTAFLFFLQVLLDEIIYQHVGVEVNHRFTSFASSERSRLGSIFNFLSLSLTSSDFLNISRWTSWGGTSSTSSITILILFFPYNACTDLIKLVLSSPALS